MKLTIKKLGAPDEVRPFNNGRLELYKFGEEVVGKGCFEPGWRWSKDVQPLAGTSSCQVSHACYCLSGRMHLKMDDGSEAELGPGEMTFIQPGHDAWVVGQETCMLLDFGDIGRYAMAEAIPGVKPGVQPAERPLGLH